MQQKKTRDQENHHLLPPCSEKCRRKCAEKFSEQQRQGIFDNFWEMGYNRRRDWLVHNVDEEQKRSFTTKNRTSRRESTLRWRFSSTQVCKCFFLHTIWYRRDQVVETALRNVRKEGDVVVGANGDGAVTMNRETSSMRPIAN